MLRVVFKEEMMQHSWQSVAGVEFKRSPFQSLDVEIFYIK